MKKILTYDEAKKFYDSFGLKQDKQFYEESAFNELIEHGEFDKAKNVVEFGCGTGKLASRLLKYNLPNDCCYLGFDISQTMIVLCQKNIEPFSNRANCHKSEGIPEIDVPDQFADRFVSTYVLDLLSENDIITLQHNAYRILSTGGYLCLVSLTHGVNFISRIVEFVWSSLFRLNSSIVGGCRPINITDQLKNDKWQIIHSSTIVSYGVPSEVIVARKI